MQALEEACGSHPSLLWFLIPKLVLCSTAGPMSVGYLSSYLDLLQFILIILEVSEYKFSTSYINVISKHFTIFVAVVNEFLI